MSHCSSSGRTALVDPRTGEVRRVELFVALLGAGLTYAEATTTQQLPDWVDARIRMIEYLGGTTDQLKSAITRPAATSRPDFATRRSSASAP